MVTQTCGTSKIHEIVHLKQVIVWYVNYIIIKLLKCMDGKETDEKRLSIISHQGGANRTLLHIGTQENLKTIAPKWEPPI